MYSNITQVGVIKGVFYAVATNNTTQTLYYMGQCTQNVNSTNYPIYYGYMCGWSSTATTAWVINGSVANFTQMFMNISVTTVYNVSFYRHHLAVLDQNNYHWVLQYYMNGTTAQTNAIACVNSTFVWTMGMWLNITGQMYYKNVSNTS